MDEYRHFLLTDTATAEAYTSTSSGGGEFKTPPRDTAKHGQRLTDQMREATSAVDAGAAQQPVLKDLHVIPLTFESAPDYELKLESLESKQQGLRIMDVRKEDGKQAATVAIPKDKTDHFIKRFQQCLKVCFGFSPVACPERVFSKMAMFKATVGVKDTFSSKQSPTEAIAPHVFVFTSCRHFGYSQLVF